MLSLVAVVLATQLVGCASSSSVDPIARVIPESRLVEISVLTTSSTAIEIPPKSRIVVADIAGDCAVELKNALTRRLVDNADFEVLSRDNLEQILIESDNNWAGRFNTETAVKLGRLLGASLFIVGQVVYCGPSGGQFDSYESGDPYDIFAVLQIIDPETGKVVMSSANEGKYLPDSAPLLFSATPEDYAQAVAETAVDVASVAQADDRSSKKKGRFKKLSQKLARALEEVQQPIAEKAEVESTQPEDKSQGSTVNYPAFKASEDLANGFADKFFSRPTWEKVEMWESSYWNYGDSVRYVKLGQCPMALSYLRERAAPEVAQMPDKDVAEYLHNLGVALLCADKPEEAMDKLRSAYRIGYDQSTLRMIGLAAKVMEWSLDVQIDTQPEVGMLVSRHP